LNSLETKKEVRAKMVNRIQTCVTLSSKDIHAVIGINKQKLNRWKREFIACKGSEDQKCKLEAPHCLTSVEVAVMNFLFTSPAHVHFPIISLCEYARREGLLYCNVNTWYKYIKFFQWKREKVSKEVKQYEQGIRTIAPDILWHMDMSELQLTNGKKLYLQVVIDNFSRYIVHWRLSQSKTSLETQEFLSEVANLRGKTIMVDSGGENLAKKVTGDITQKRATLLLSRKETHFSNSIIEAFFRMLKYNYLYHHEIVSKKSMEEHICYYIRQYNTVIPHSSHNGYTPEEKYLKKDRTKEFEEIAKKHHEVRANRIKRNKGCSACV